MKLHYLSVTLIICIPLGFLNAENTRGSNNGCSLQLPTDIPENEPLYLEYKPDGSLNLYAPNGQVNIIPDKTAIVLFCPGPRNKLSNSKDNWGTLPCTKNRFSTRVNEITCQQQVRGDVIMTQQQCGNPSGENQGMLIEIGFDTGEQFVKLFQVCYNKKTASAIYSLHVLHGKLILHNVKQSKRPSFKVNEIPKQAKVEFSYRKDSQVARFTALLGRRQNFFTTKSFLARGHLAPDADFIFSSGQFATYFYVNVHPQFQVINSGNWIRVENMTRKIAAELKEDLFVCTGAYEILQIPNDIGDLVALYLSDNQLIQIPKWTWKIIRSKKRDSAIVFITLNDPFANRNEIDEFCPNVCKEAGILTRDTFEVIAKGYTFCCNLTDFRKNVNTVPLSLKAKTLLKCNFLSENVSNTNRGRQQNGNQRKGNQQKGNQQKGKRNRRKRKT